MKNIKEIEVLQQQINEDNKYLIENKQKRFDIEIYD